MVHFMTHYSSVEIARGISQLEIEGIYPFIVDVNISVENRPFMRPKQRAPCAHVSPYNETHIVNTVVIVIVYVQSGRDWIVVVDIGHSAFQQVKLTFSPFRIVLIAVSIGT